MKKVDNDYILDTVYDLADGAGMRIDAFLDALCEQYGEKEASLDGLPEEIVSELTDARQSKKDKRMSDRQQKESEKSSEEIKSFRSLFPDTAADDIPDEVWEEVASGVSLPHAYALYLVKDGKLNSYASGVNERNRESGAAIASDGSTEPVYTRESVEKMSDSDVKSNYKGILKAMKNWRFN